MWQEHLHATLTGMRLHQLKSDRCVWVKKNIIVLAYVDDWLIAGTSRDTTSCLEQLRQSFSLKHSTVLTSSQQPLRFLSCESTSADIRMTSRSVLRDPTTTACSRTWTSTTIAILHQHHACSDLQHNKIHIWILTDITSTAKLLACSSGQHRYVLTPSLKQKTTFDILHHLQNGIGNISSTLSGTSREPCATSSSSHLSYLKVTHYLFGSRYLCTSTPTVTVTWPQTSTLASLPLAQLPVAFNSRT